MDEVYVWTEALGCAEILLPMLKSFTKHHNVPIHVYIYEEDLNLISNLKNIKPVVINDSEKSLVKESILKEAFKEGHKGTGLLWSNIINSKKNAILIHLDADTIFLGEVLTMILDGLKFGGIVGSRRPYRYTASRRNLRKFHLFFRPDAVNTHAFGFRNGSNNQSIEELLNKIVVDNRTFFEKIFFPVIDFFDPMTFYLRSKSGIYYLDSKNQNKSGNYSRFGTFESKMISFSAVGSGYSFFYGKSNTASQSYKEFAISSYALYSKHLLGVNIGVEPLKSEYLENLLSTLDTSTWTLRHDS